MTMEEIQNWVKEKIKRKLHVVGVHIGSEAYCIGAEGILTAGGFFGEVGLEAYSCFHLTRLGIEEVSHDFIDELVEIKTDVLIVSFQTLPQDPQILKKLKDLGEEVRKSKKISEHCVKIIVGSLAGKLPHSLHFDLGFEERTSPLQVAHDLIQKLACKMEGKKSGQRPLWKLFGKKKKGVKE